MVLANEWRHREENRERIFREKFAEMDKMEIELRQNISVYVKKNQELDQKEALISKQEETQRNKKLLETTVVKTLQVRIIAESFHSLWPKFVFLVVFLVVFS